MALPAPIIVPQIQLSDLDLYAAQGVSTVISCRPDDEDPNQLTFRIFTGGSSGRDGGVPNPRCPG